MENHYYDASGIYTRSAPANPGSLCPVNALRTQPPRREGHWPVLAPAGEGWELTPDHRGRKGWVHGCPTTIVRLGPLPEDWSDTAPVAENSHEDARKHDDFAAETEPLLLKIVAYQAEAEAAALDGDAETQKMANDKKSALLRQYRTQKRQIRNHSSLPDQAIPSSDIVTGESQPHDSGADTRIYLTSSGSYHVEGCRYTNAAGKWLSPVEALATGRKIKPCSRCRPGRLED